MAEIEYKGVKVGGSKLLLIIPLIGTLIGGLWGGFEVYQRYLLMEKKINYAEGINRKKRSQKKKKSRGKKKSKTRRNKKQRK